MNYLSVCSGVEAASVAWKGLGWNPLGFSEIEKFPSEVLQHHYPNVPNLGDMNNYKEWNFGKRSVDLVVGGTPCQSFSVAGLRKGMEDPRGNLALTFCAILDKFRPKWFVWENVPGVLSSNKGRDFGSFLGAVAELGYGASYRVLDAQNFGVPQRRRRVFVVGHIGDWSPTAEVLFEPESLSRHIEESRKKRKDTPRDSSLGIDTSGPLAARDYKDMGTDGLNKTSSKMIPTIAHCLETTSNDYSRADGFNMIPEKTDALLARDYKGLNSDSLASKAIVEVFENHPSDSRVKEMGETCQTVTSTWGAGGGNIPFVLGGQHPNAAVSENESPTLTNAMGSGGGHVPVINEPFALAENTIGRQPLNGGNGDGYTEKTPMYTLNATGVHGVAHGFEPGIAKREGNPSRFTEEKSPTIRANMGDNQVAVSNQMAVRKLTPVECERLQGFPDNYTNIKENCPDGHRYKAMGNSMAVPVMRWIGERINNYKEENYAV
jgi:DNA (cytosine-5)-methyltransferase 1